VVNAVGMVLVAAGAAVAVVAVFVDVVGAYVVAVSHPAPPDRR
jgi:hypothetical protein